MVRALSPDDVLRLRFIRDAQISPNGQAFTFAISYTDRTAGADRSEIRIHDLHAGVERRVSDTPMASSPRWSHDGSHLAFLTVVDGRNFVVIARAHSGTLRRLEIPLATEIASPPAWSPNGRTIALVLQTNATDSGEVRRIAGRHFRADGVGYIDGLRQRVCLLDVSSGSLTTIVDEPGFYSNLEWDDAGERILFIRSSRPIQIESRHQLCSVRVADRRVDEYLGSGWFLSCARWAPDGRIAVIGAYESPVPVPTTDLWVIDTDTRASTCRSLQFAGRVGFRFHHDMPLWDLGSYGITMAGRDSAWVTVQLGGRAEIWEIPLSGEGHGNRVVGGERCCIVLNASAAKDKLLFLATDMMSPVDVHLCEQGSERRLTDMNRDVLAEWPEMRQQHFRYRSAEGLELDAWFMSQPAHGGAIPTVMFIHGGPYTAVGHAYRFDFHLLASNGYGVVFANFRGSFGYGEEFAMAIVGDVGGRGFPDHMGAIDHAIALGLADPGRLGVWGASHGGFATCWVVGHTNRFRAAVAEAAITDITLAYYVSDVPDYRSFDLGGKPHEIPDIFRARSPLTYAHRCRTPTLLIHGDNDLRCPIAGAEQFHRALLDAGCISELVRLKDASHLGDSVGPPAIRVAQNAALVDWFKRFL